MRVSSLKDNTHTNINTVQGAKSPVVPNFRAAAGAERSIYRCGNPDGLASVLEEASSTDLSQGDYSLLYDTTLLIDLRTESERDAPALSAFYKRAPGGSFTVIPDNQLTVSGESKKGVTPNRQVLRSDLISKVLANLDKYLAMYSLEPLSTTNKMSSFQHFGGPRGLTRLNEIMLLDSKSELSRILKAITLHLEEFPGGNVTIHCTQGKDRTGLVVMLIQSVLGVSDTIITNDFAMSKQVSAMPSQMLHAAHKLGAGNVDLTAFACADPQIMIATMLSIRAEYGSICPGYVGSIGFNEEWQRRLQKAVPTVGLENEV